jgi:hypothetical protein
MLMIKVDTDVEHLSPTMRRQMPFAIALALTRTVKEGQAEVIRQLPQRFTIKNGWTARQIRIKAATKSSLIAEVTAPDYMAKQEAGGTRTPDGNHLATPGASLHGRLIPRSSRPGAVFGKPRTFKLFGAGGREAIAQRLSGKTRQFRILYWLTDTQQYDERFEMGRTVANVVDRKFESELVKAMGAAMRTAR